MKEVELTIEESKFLIENKRETKDVKEVIASLWEYWSSTDIPLTSIFDRISQIKEKGFTLAKEKKSC